MIAVAGYGDLLSAMTARWATWQEFVGVSVREGVQAVETFKLLTPRARAVLARLPEKVTEHLVPASPQLNWGDVNMDNILVDADGRLTGLLDFEGALSGDVLLTMGYALALYGRSDFVEDLARAWPEPLETNAWRRAQFYAVLRGLRIAPYYVSPLLPNGARRLPLTAVFPGGESALDLLATRSCLG
jgi:Ser/Thr protein kinase RdoA (MazF antagonist)